MSGRYLSIWTATRRRFPALGYPADGFFLNSRSAPPPVVNSARKTFPTLYLFPTVLAFRLMKEAVFPASRKLVLFSGRDSRVCPLFLRTSCIINLSCGGDSTANLIYTKWWMSKSSDPVIMFTWTAFINKRAYFENGVSVQFGVKVTVMFLTFKMADMLDTDTDWWITVSTWLVILIYTLPKKYRWLSRKIVQN